ncbi:MAG TPA: caspase family protein [Cyclobacteriaceae bacterium]|nr:caspase family protein [Cyclobacteriaceae bacterium]
MKKLTLPLALIVLSTSLFAQDLKKATIKVKSPIALTYSPDSKYLALSTPSELQLLNAGSDTKATTFAGSRGVNKMMFSNDNASVAAACSDETIKIWTVPDGKLTATLKGHTASVIDVRFFNGDKSLVSISEDKSVNLWDVASAKLIASEKDHTKSLRGLDVSADGKWIATGGAERDIFMRDANTGKTVKKIQGHDGWVRALAFSPDGKILASGGDDKKIILWDVETGKKVKEFPQRGWIYDLKYSNDGKFVFAALEKNAVGVYDVNTGLPALKLDDFETSVLALAVSPSGKELATLQEFVNEAKYWNIESLNISPVFRFKDKKDINPPQIFVSNPPSIQDNQVRYSKDLIDITGSVIDESGVRRLRVNGIETPLKTNGNFVIKLPLSMGDNFVTIEATDVNDNIALKKFSILRKDLDGGDYDPSKAKNFLMVVGINNYQYWPHLNNAVKDANDMAGTLMGLYNFDFSNVTVLRDEQATRSNIYKTLRSYISQVASTDNLVIYFSGHGHFDELLNEGYWIPYEAHLNEEGDYLPNSSILKIIESINSQHTFLVADACFSGSLFGEQKRGYAENVEKFKSRWGLASGRLETVSDGAQGTNSPFATQVIKFLKENKKDKIAVSELIQSVKLGVAETTNQTPIGNPLKVSGDEGGELVFYKKK